VKINVLYQMGMLKKFENDEWNVKQNLFFRLLLVVASPVVSLTSSFGTLLIINKKRRFNSSDFFGKIVQWRKESSSE
jgi:hypothetical protein